MPEFDPSTWMSSLPDKTINLSELTIPGTHDTFCSESKIEAGLASFNKSFAACQHDSFSIADQLNAGIRLLDFRVEFGGKLSHGVARLDGDLYEQIRIVANFLEHHPSEAVLVSVKWELEALAAGDGFWGNFTPSVRGTPEPEGEAARIVQRLRDVPGSKWWMQPTIPTVAQAAGKMVFLTRLSESCEEGIRYSPGGENPQGSAPYRSQDHYNMDRVEGAGWRKWSEHVEPFLKRTLDNPQDGVLWINFLSAYAGPGTPWSENARPIDVANVVNSCLRDFAQHAGHQPGLRRFGILLMDFPDSTLLQALVLTNFRRN